MPLLLATLVVSPGNHYLQPTDLMKYIEITLYKQLTAVKLSEDQYLINITWLEFLHAFSI